MSNLSIDEVNDIDGFRSLKESWNILLQQSNDNNIFLTWEWLFNWWKYFGEDKKLRIFLIRESDKIIGIAPFMESKYREGFFGVNVIENLCSENCDYSGIILAEKAQESVTLLIEYLARIINRENLVVRMYHVPKTSTFLSILHQGYPSYAKTLVINENVVSSCPYLVLPATWEEFLHSIRKKRRGNLRRSMQTLQQDHKVDFKKYTTSDDLKNQLPVLFELHEKRWQGKNIISKFTTQQARDFYMDISQAFIQNGWLSFSSLNVDEKPASILWGFNYRDTWWDMTPAFDSSYSRYSIGNLHMMKIIEEAIHIGLHKIDFLKGAASYKFHWTNDKTDNYRITIAPKGFRGRYRTALLQSLIKYKNTKSRNLRENMDLLIKKIRPKSKISEE